MRSKAKSEGMSLVNFFTIAEAALIFGVRKKQIYDWIQAGRLRVFQLGRGEHATRIRRQDLDKLIKALRNGELEIPNNPVSPDESTHPST